MSDTTNKKTNWLVEAVAGFAVIYFATHWRQCSWFGGQDERKALTEMAEKLKNEGKVTNYSFEGDTLQLNYLLPEETGYDMDSVAKYPDLFKQLFLCNLTSDELKETSDELSKAKVILAFDFTKLSSGKHARFVISPEDFSMAESTDYLSSNNDNKLLLYVDVHNKLNDNRNGFDNDSDIDNAYLSLEDNYLLVHFVMKEDLSSVPVISTKAEALKKMLKELVSDDSYKEIISLAVQTNRGAKLVIHGKKSGATATATLSSDELREL